MTTTYQYVMLETKGRTPIQVFQTFTGKKKFLLESTFTHEKKGKYSFLGMNPYEEITGERGKTTVINFKTNEKKIVNENALHYMQKQMPVIETHLPIPFFGGAIGYVGYDAIRELEQIGSLLPDELQMPPVHFMLFKDIIVFDHTEEMIYLIAVNPYEDRQENLEERLEKLQDQLNKDPVETKANIEQVDFVPEETEASFTEKIAKAQRYVERGEVLQVVLSQRMTAKITNKDTFAFSFYKTLRKSNPSPYMFYVDFEEYTLLGSSPESLLSVTNGIATSNPIAGTRHRGATIEEDARLEEELLADEKELAEHRMLVDLSKHDLSQVCEKETIELVTDMAIERYQHVMHIVSEVKGRLQEDKSSLDALIACLPAGTVSGAPKRRAMQIINELEDKMRGAYGGGVGYVNFNRDLNMALTIRSLVVKEQTAYLQAGAGIVQDSIPKKEFEETLHKAKALLEAAYTLQ